MGDGPASASLAALMADDGADAGDVEKREMLAAVQRRLFARASATVSMGRYVDLKRIGAGGMGIVYSALDPKLQRRVALKVLRQGTGGRREILREAQTLARVSHPHIVQVLDAGVTDGETWIALELVEGSTLRQWCAQPRPWSELVAAVADAASGLVAAHDVGIVHRDFKPANVLVGADGRMRVTDFGLAVGPSRSTEPSLRQRDSARSSDSSPSLASIRTSRSHAVGGTPGYAAPEQLRPGQLVTPAADQFAVCVVLYEALTGRRPFPSDTLSAFATAVADGPVFGPIGGAPRRVARLIRRGLLAHPAERFDSMAALVGELRATLQPSRTPQWVGAMLAVGIGVGTLGDSEREPCRLIVDADEIWDASTQQRAQAAFAGSDVPYRDLVFARADAAMQRGAARWGAAAVEACQDAELADEPSSPQMACLAAQAEGLATTAELLATADADRVTRADALVAALPDSDDCTDRAAPPNPVQARVARSLDRAASRARPLLAAAQLDAAQSALEVDVRDADPEALGSRLAIHDALHGRLARARGAVSEAMTRFESAYHRAIAEQMDAVAASSAGTIAVVIGLDGGDLPASRPWARHAEAAAQRLGGRGPDAALVWRQLAGLARNEGDLALAELRIGKARAALDPDDASPDLAGIMTTLGAILVNAGRIDEAHAVLVDGLARTRDAYGGVHPQLVMPLANLASVLKSQGDLSASRRRYDEALRVAEQTLGPSHHRTAAIIGNIGALAKQERRNGDAIASFERALAIYEANPGAPDRRVAITLTNLAPLYAARGDVQLAATEFERAITIFGEIFGPESAMLGRVLINRAGAEREWGDDDAARLSYERGLKQLSRALGSDHIDVAVAHSNLGMIYTKLEQLSRAREHLAEALRIRRSQLGRHAATASALVALGVVETDAGNYATALEALNEAVSIYDEVEVEASRRVEARHALADAQWRSGDQSVGVKTAQDAERRCETADDAGAEQRCIAVDEWLREHRV